MIEIIINDRCMYYSFLSIFKFSRICLGAEENLEIRFFKKCLELPDIESKSKATQWSGVLVLYITEVGS